MREQGLVLCKSVKKKMKYCDQDVKLHSNIFACTHILLIITTINHIYVAVFCVLGDILQTQKRAHLQDEQDDEDELGIIRPEATKWGGGLAAEIRQPGS